MTLSFPTFPSNLGSGKNRHVPVAFMGQFPSPRVPLASGVGRGRDCLRLSLGYTFGLSIFPGHRIYSMGISKQES